MGTRCSAHLQLLANESVTQPLAEPYPPPPASSVICGGRERPCAPERGSGSRSVGCPSDVRALLLARAESGVEGGMGRPGEVAAGGQPPSRGPAAPRDSLPGPLRCVGAAAWAHA